MLALALVAEGVVEGAADAAQDVAGFAVVLVGELVEPGDELRLGEVDEEEFSDVVAGGAEHVGGGFGVEAREDVGVEGGGGVGVEDVDLGGHVGLLQQGGCGVPAVRRIIVYPHPPCQPLLRYRLGAASRIQTHALYPNPTYAPSPTTPNQPP